MRASRRGNVVLAVLLVVGSVAVTALAMTALGRENQVLAAPVVPASGERNTITVLGQGSGVVVPDQATLTLGVSVSRPNVHTALNVADTEMGKLVASLRRSGVQDKDMQTNAVSVNKEMNYNVVTGYNAANSVQVTLHHIANVGSLIGSAVDAVGNDIQVNGVNVSLSDAASRGQLKTARAAAMADAAARAQAWASLGHKHVGKMLAVSELISSQPSGTPCYGQCGGGGPAIMPGQSSVGVTVTVVYELVD
jgi:uncharacterized protein